ncbi:hypothetical protein ICN48_06245 [Polynucleobacter sp. JS-Safj-400b-B2]|uniref:hypothetical protein n=1 Tax=Polynucleobacter sp. JS-Safj-400b-B2 TaxID=2576921 RepID=UPI001C0AA786|nr:hypothetical protein [Polynucleobacter sp. JS-Safj-400b-B2]MBU3625832.1 hypothetical protein [Polynucleobacter sp. JS-Safj-400b-B2]
MGQKMMGKPLRRLNSFLEDARKSELEVYGTTSKIVKTINVGSGEFFEVHYFEDGEEISNAYFYSHGDKLVLSDAEIKTLSSAI